MFKIYALLSAGVLLTAFNTAEAACMVKDLRCEYLRNPLGLDVAQPRFSWMIESGERGARQTARQILVSDEEDLIKKDQGNIWDSGKVESDQSVLVVYEGKPLASRGRYYWKTRVWDQSGQASEWSEPACWSMGLLSEDEWAAQWIGCDWMPDNVGALPLLRKTFKLDSAPKRAEISVCALGYYELHVNGQKAGDAVLTPASTDYATRGLSITHDVTALLKPGENCVALWLGRGWSTPALSQASKSGPLVKARLDVFGADGKRNAIVTDDSWKSHPSCITPIGKGGTGDYGGESYDARLETHGRPLKFIRRRRKSSPTNQSNRTVSLERFALFPSNRSTTVIWSTWAATTAVGSTSSFRN
jgi:hypothetical protein